MKFSVYAIYTASQYLGEVEANSEEDAKEKAEDMEAFVSLCHECARKVDLSDVNDFEVQKAE